ncbi:hypothetical protein CN331_00655 [Bacillus cereus]|uniref:MarR family winged helix-turn-helix transcriptional regulator n=1 Tax=Bacillus cereus group TaxID=86661 RepID=UPI000BEDDE76|nr:MULTISPECIES: MarR family winged helix-turn-helix transcriptional regulator [Bacillus cereus group]PEE08312.1 hypothetical protein CON52_31090 [Bacillus cereus]PEQ27604.1 hypothetical protein CN471_29805 [Bacillus thuringiensis]PEY26339.1 hypothetical protein CN331_00655 [Bacillus cereus]
MNKDHFYTLNIAEITERIGNDDCAYQVLMAFINENGEAQMLNKTAVAEMIQLSKPTVFATVNSFYCAGYIDETRVGRSKIYTLSDLGVEIVECFKQKAMEMRNL